jgi:hypothetical protein
MAYQGPPGSGRATGAANRGNAQNAQNAQATRPASDLPANAQRGPSEEEEEEGALLEILSLFTDYVIPGLTYDLKETCRPKSCEKKSKSYEALSTNYRRLYQRLNLEIQHGQR